MPYGVRIYDARATPDDVLVAFDREMPARGWTPNDVVARELAARGTAGRAFTKDGADVMVLAARDRRDPSHAVVSIVHMAPR